MAGVAGGAADTDGGVAAEVTAFAELSEFEDPEIRAMLPRIVTAAIALALVQGGTAPLDLTKVERKIAKEPSYVSEPRYALLVFDDTRPFRCWMVFDKSKVDAPYYDVLYFDRNGDGDLTEPEERITGKYDEGGAAAGIAMSFRIKELPVPGTSLVHKDFLFSTAPKANRGGFWFRFHWDGKTEFSGGYYPTGTNTTEWGASVATAPLLHPTLSGPFQFALWQESTAFTIGGENHTNVLVGTQGIGAGSLLVVDETFLDLAKDELTCTVITKDAEGRPLETRSRIKSHC